MYGTSYAGSTRSRWRRCSPPALKAIIPIYATDRRYTDDVHYGGGVRRGIDFLDYPMYMVAMNALPPVPSVYGEGWREEWLRRIEANEPWELRWLEQQTEDDYWRHGSVWFDGYERDRGGHDDRRGPRRRLPQHGVPRRSSGSRARSGCSSARGAT